MATFPARGGDSCAIFEQAKFPRYHIGESLIPHTHGIFNRLGLGNLFRVTELTHAGMGRVDKAPWPSRSDFTD